MKDRWDEVIATIADAGWEAGDCHDLLHRPFTPACWQLPGGPSRHLKLWWQYQGWADVRTRVTCRVGRHRYLPYYSGTAGPHQAPDGLSCLDCGGR